MSEDDFFSYEKQAARDTERAVQDSLNRKARNDAIMWGPTASAFLYSGEQAESYGQGLAIHAGLKSLTSDDSTEKNKTSYVGRSYRGLESGHETGVKRSPRNWFWVRYPVASRIAFGAILGAAIGTYFAHAFKENPLFDLLFSRTYFSSNERGGRNINKIKLSEPDPRGYRTVVSQTDGKISLG